MWPFDRKQKREAATAEAARVQAIAARNFAIAMRDIPKGRVSQDETGWMGMLSWLEDAFDGYPDASSNQIRQLLRQASQADDDIAGSLRDLKAMTNTGWSWDFAAGTRATSAAQDALNDWEKTVYPGGLTTLVNNQVGELYHAGASSLEWVPDPSRRSVTEVIVVKAERIKIRRDKETQHIRYWQQGPATDIELSPITYHYQAIETDGEGYHGVPLAIAVPAALARKKGIYDGVEKVIQLMGRAALITAMVPPPTPEELGLESREDPKFNELEQAYYSSISELLVQNTEYGMYVMPQGPDGSTELKATPIPQTATGLKDILELNERTLWNASVTLPFMRGDMSANYALARVVWPILAQTANNVQAAIKEQLEFGANLHLRLAGIPATAYLKWGERANPFVLEDAQAENLHARTDEVLLKLFGKAAARRIMRRWDIEDTDAENAPKWWDERGADATESETTETDVQGQS